MKANTPSNVVRVNDFFEAMSRIATTVNVVTSDGPAGRTGITVSAMSSVTADPPTLLICIQDTSPSSAIIETNGRFCVNVLKQSQQEVSEIFAGRTSLDYDAHFESDNWDMTSFSCPFFRESLAAFDCIVSQHVKVGTHTIFFGEIQKIHMADGDPLIYVNRNYQ